jgi:hypothetical protein
MKMAGVTATGQTPLAEDSVDVFRLLNSMISSWSQSRWMCTHLIDVSHQVDDQQTFTVGIGGDFDVKKPSKLQSAYLRWVDNVGGTAGTDTPLVIIDTHEEWADISQKDLNGFPTSVFYDNTSVPMGTLYVWPVPSNVFELHILVKDRLVAFPSLTAPILLDEEYFEALLYNLTGRVQMLYSMPINPGVVQLARAGLNAIKMSNHRVPDLQMPPGLSRAHGDWPGHGGSGVVGGVFTLDEDLLG